VLQIKLPKGKTAKAIRSHASWHQRMGRYWIPFWTEYHVNRADHFYAMAEACTCSAGDVYVSLKLWYKIRDFYG